MSAEDEFDIVVIGGGPAGYATALYGASAGLSMAVVERDKVGGTCLHRGCVPAKEFLDADRLGVPHRSAPAGDFGVNAWPRPGQHRTSPVSQASARTRVVEQALQGSSSGLLKGRKVTILSGTGTLEADRRVPAFFDGEDAGRELIGRATSCWPPAR